MFIRPLVIKLGTNFIVVGMSMWWWWIQLCSLVFLEMVRFLIFPPWCQSCQTPTFLIQSEIFTKLTSQWRYMRIWIEASETFYKAWFILIGKHRKWKPTNFILKYEFIEHGWKLFWMLNIFFFFNQINVHSFLWNLYCIFYHNDNQWSEFIVI